ncbi:MAG: glycosyltransferase family 4 protein [Methanolinea sp.]|nr:glycosyltransferase family 4 protein [Methanolinea sp.]
MRILLIHSYYERFGGGEVYVQSFIRLLQDHGHEIYFFSFSNDKESEEENHLIMRDRFQVKNKNFLSLFFRYFLRFYFDPFVAFKLRQWIRKVKPDIIHIHANDRFGISVLIALINIGIPVIQTVHAYTIVCMSTLSRRPSDKMCNESHGVRCLAFHCLPLGKFFAIIPSYAIKWALTKRIVNKMIVANPQIQKRLNECGYGKTILIEHFVDIPREYLEKIPIEKGFLLCVGRLTWEKGFQYVIRAMVKVKEKAPYTTLHICGNGPYEENLKELVHELSLDDSVFFHGHLDSLNLKEFYKKSNIIIFPSLCLEICGLVNLEALSYGKPLIISNVSGVEELFQGKKVGFFVDPKDCESFSHSILKILLDENLFLEMGRNAYEMYREKFNPDAHYQKIMSLYKELLTQS